MENSGGMDGAVVWGVIGALCVAAGVAIAYFKKKGGGNLLDFNRLAKLIPFPEAKKLEIIDLPDIIGWFKEPEINELLRSNPDYEAVAVIDKKPDKIEIALCVFDKAKGEIKKIQILEAPAITERADLQFGDKKMIVLR